MTVLITLLLSVLILLVLFFVFASVKTPYYRTDQQRMIQVLEMVLTGQATANNWYVTFGMAIRHSPELEAVRQRCIDVEEHHYIGEQHPPYLFAPSGLQQLHEILSDLKTQSF
ncbi:MAG: hypothetical protein ACI8VC_002231 [Candidatus Endobugula sp.]|jgi:hypothetical protein